MVSWISIFIMIFNMILGVVVLDRLRSYGTFCSSAGTDHTFCIPAVLCRKRGTE